MLGNKRLFITIIIFLVAFSFISQINLLTETENQNKPVVSTKNSTPTATTSYLSENGNSGTDSQKARNGIFIEGNLSYIILNNQFEIYNVQNPNKPILLYSKENEEDHTYEKIFVNNSIAYLMNSRYLHHGIIIEIYNCTNPAIVLALSSTTLVVFGSSFFVLGNYFYVISEIQLVIFEMDTSYDLFFIKEIYLIDFDDSLTYNYYYDLIDYSYEDNILCILGEREVFVLNVIDPSNPISISTFKHHQNMDYSNYHHYYYYYYYDRPSISLKDNNLYILHSGNFTSFNIANLLNINQTAYFNVAYNHNYGRSREMWITDNNAFLLFGKYLHVYNLNSNGIPTNLIESIDITIGNLDSNFPKILCIGFFIKNDLMYVIKGTISIEGEILIIYNISDVSSISIIWNMVFSDPLKYSNLVLYLGIFLSVLFIALISIFMIYHGKKKEIQPVVDVENIEVDKAAVETPNVVEKNDLITNTPHGNKLIRISFLLLFVQNLSLLFIAIPIFGGLTYDRYSNFTYALNVPLFLDIIAIVLLIIGFSLKTKENKSKNNIYAIIIWIIWIISALLYRVIWDLPSYSFVYGILYADNPTYQDYLIQLPFLASTLLFSLAIIATIVFTDVGNKSRPFLQFYAIMNAIIGIIFYFGKFVDVRDSIIFYDGNLLSWLFFVGLVGLIKITIVPAIAIMVFISLFSNYELELKNKII